MNDIRRSEDDGDDNQIPDTNESPNTADSSELSHPIDMEVLEGAFRDEKSPMAKNSGPTSIKTNSEGDTTVERGDLTTLYDNEGEIVQSISTGYLRKRRIEGMDPGLTMYLHLKGENEESCATIYLTQKVLEEIKGMLDARSIQLYSSFRPGSNGPFRLDTNQKEASAFVKMVAAARPGGLKTNNECKDLHVLDQSSPRVGNREWREIIDELVDRGKLQVVTDDNINRFELGATIDKSIPKEIKEKYGNIEWYGDIGGKRTFIFGNGNLNILDWSDDISANWTLERIDLPQDLKTPTAAGLDPRDNFILIGSRETLYVLDKHSSPMKVVHSQEVCRGLNGIIDVRDGGDILVGDNSGDLTHIIGNLSTFTSREETLERRRALQKLHAKNRVRKFRDANAQEGGVSQEYKEFSEQEFGKFKDDIDSALSLEDIERLREEIIERKKDYLSTLGNTKLANDIFKKTEDYLKEKESELLALQVDSEMVSVRKLLERVDGMSLWELSEARQRIDRTKSTIMGSKLDAAVKTEVTQISDAFAERASDILAADEDKILEQIDLLLDGVKQKLDGITKLSEFEVWQSADYPAFIDAINANMKILPASHTKALERLRGMEEEVRKLKKQYSERFKEQYDEVRQQAANKTDIVVGIAVERIEEFLESFMAEVRKKAFRTTDEAKQWVERNPLYSSTISVIEDLKTQDPDKADELEQRLKVEVSQISYEVKRLKDVGVDDSTGRQMAMFGSAAFPVWEHKTEKKEDIKPPKVELTYRVDEKSKGPGVKPEDYMCEVFYKVTHSDGKVEQIPFHQDDTRKYGRYDERFYDDGAYFPSYMPLKDARKMLSAVKGMRRKGSKVKEEYDTYRAKIQDLKQRIKKLKAENDGNWDSLRVERSDLTKGYITFLQDSGLHGWFSLNSFKRRVENGENVDDGAGQGLVPDWAPYWIVDKDTDKSLEQFAKMAKMSLGLKEGMISLEGHAGTGKDVLVQMFANKTKRPLYSFDCTKWTTEFDLSQDVSLAAEDGASFTVKEDSVIVKALETPGAILYFNEFNAMPEQAQIFLHSLFDAKRQVTLKTSAGRVVKADPSVVICSSMNPGYPGTNHPQFATRSRMIPIQLKFPEFKMEDGTYSSAEALRIARSVKSLQDLTYNPDIEENEFVKLWDNYINRGVSNGSLTPERRFDMDVMFNLITFAGELREGFINKISKKGKRGTFTISQPFTLREMRRCAYTLSTMSDSEKQNPDGAEKVAKDLVRRFYSQYIFDEKEAEVLETHLKQWTAQKPMNP